MKKALILINHSGGLFAFRKELVEKLLASYEVYAATPFVVKVDELKQLGCKMIPINFRSRGMNPIRDLKLLYEYFRLVSKERPDLIITYTIKPNIYGGAVCRLLRVPYAVNITGLGMAFQNNGLLRNITVSMYRFALKEAKVVFFENSANMDLFIDERLIGAKQACLLNGAGVNLEKFRFQEYPHNALTKFLFIGRVMKEKGMDELLEATDRLQEIIGGGCGWMCLAH